MRQWMFGLAAAAAVFAPAAARADDKPAADAKAVAVVKKAIEATGGADLLSKYPAARTKVKGETTAMGQDVAFTGTIVYLLPDKFKLSMDLEVAGLKLPVVQVVNGQSVKMTVSGMAVPLPDGAKEEMLANVVELEVSQLTPLLDAKKYTLKAGGEAEVGGKKADVVVVSGKRLGDKEMKLFFDQKTGLLVKTHRKGTDQEAMKEVDEESLMEDYKKVGGIMTPMKTTILHDGKKYLTMTFTDVEYLEKVDPKEFATDD